MITPVSIVLFAGTTLALWLGALVYRRASTPGASTFVWLMAAVALWYVTSAFHALTPGLDQKILWAKLQYVGTAAVPPLWFIFLSDYVGARWAASRRLRLVLGLVAVTTVALTLTKRITPPGVDSG